MGQIRRRKRSRSASLRMRCRALCKRRDSARQIAGIFPQDFEMKSISPIQYSSTALNFDNENQVMMESSSDSSEGRGATVQTEPSACLENSDPDNTTKTGSNFVGSATGTDLQSSSARNVSKNDSTRYANGKSRVKRSNYKPRRCHLRADRVAVKRFPKCDNRSADISLVYPLPEPPTLLLPEANTESGAQEDTPLAAPYLSPSHSRRGSLHNRSFSFQDCLSDDSQLSSLVVLQKVEVSDIAFAPLDTSIKLEASPDKYLKFLTSPYKVSRFSWGKGSLDFFLDSPIRGLILESGSQSLQRCTRRETVRYSRRSSCSIDLGFRVTKGEGPSSTGRKSSHRRSHGRSPSVDSAWESPQYWFHRGLNSVKGMSPMEKVNAKGPCNHHPNYSTLKKFISCFSFPLSWYSSAKPPLCIKDKSSRPGLVKKSIKCLFAYPNKWHLRRKSKSNRIEDLDSLDADKFASASHPPKRAPLDSRKRSHSVEYKESVSMIFRKKDCGDNLHPLPLPSPPSHSTKSNHHHLHHHSPKRRSDRITTGSAYSANSFGKLGGCDDGETFDASVNVSDRTCTTNDALEKVLSENSPGKYSYNDSLDFEDSLSDMLISMQIEGKKWLDDLRKVSN